VRRAGLWTPAAVPCPVTTRVSVSSIHRRPFFNELAVAIGVLN
jgi:hypothetical protein